jgi:uncharacterized membrane protein YphA (DoxX/SURF4 family)
MLTFTLQTIVGLGLLNVWIIRANQATCYRGGEAKNLKDEFTTYGLPSWVYYLVGFFKVTTGLSLVVGIWLKQLVLPASLTIVVLMVGAIYMHFKVGDNIQKFIPASLMLMMSTALVVMNF